MRVMDIAQILSHSSLIEKSQQAHQRMNEEAQKMFFLNIQNEIIRKDQKIPETPEKKRAKLEEKGEEEKKQQKKHQQAQKRKGGIDIKV